MGRANIFVVRDAIDQNSLSADEKKTHESEIGAAITKLAYSPEYEETGEGKQRIREAAVANHSNRVGWVDKVDSAEQRVFVWMGNCLRPISALDQSHLDVVKNIVAEQKPATS
jgi:hypothetical protein